MNGALTAGVLVAVLVLAGAVTAGEGEGQSLEQAASDPTASLMAVQVQNIYSGSTTVSMTKAATWLCCAPRCRSRPLVSTTSPG